MAWILCLITFFAGVIVGIFTFALMDAAKRADEKPKEWWKDKEGG